MTEFLTALIELDIPRLRGIAARDFPHLPQPKTDKEALVVAHMARTQNEAVPFKLRAYSHRWLTDEEYPSQLPDNLKPSAERIYPKIVGSVGLSVNVKGTFAPVAPYIEKAMTDAVLECYADGHEEPEIVKPRMFEAKKTVVSKLLGIR